MDDIISPKPAEEPTATAEEPTGSSVQLLKETAELSDITRDQPPERGAQDSELKIEIAEEGKRGSTSIETVYENTILDKTVSSVTASRASAGTTSTAGPAAGATEICNNQTMDRYSATSGRMNKMRDHASTVFPVGTMGCKEDMLTMPSPRRFLDAGEASSDTIGHIEHTPRKASHRNEGARRDPVLGTGLDQQKQKKDESSVELMIPTPNNTGRVPPGGYSQGLW